MNLFAIGMTHRTAPLAVRERLSILSSDLPSALREVRLLGAAEAAILSTCNRVEWYGVCADPSVVLPRLVAAIARRSKLANHELDLSLVQRLDRHAAEHLFRVAGGLESMILGESEITAQIKQAYEHAQAQRSAGPVLHRLFQKALHCGKLIRSQMAGAGGHASLGAIVVDLAGQALGPRLRDADVLLWGAGKAAEASLKHLHKAGVRNLWIVNRTAERAQDLAALWQARWLEWEQASEALARVDLALICTQAPHDLIDAAGVARIMRQRAERPLALIDLAVPRNVDPAVSQVAGVRLWNVDDLQERAQSALERRRQIVAAAEPMIRERVEQFWRWWRPVVAEWEVGACGQLDEWSVG